MLDCNVIFYVVMF